MARNPVRTVDVVKTFTDAPNHRNSFSITYIANLVQNFVFRRPDKILSLEEERKKIA